MQLIIWQELAWEMYQVALHCIHSQSGKQAYRFRDMILHTFRVTGSVLTKVALNLILIKPEPRGLFAQESNHWRLKDWPQCLQRGIARFGNGRQHRRAEIVDEMTTGLEELQREVKSAWHNPRWLTRITLLAYGAIGPPPQLSKIFAVLWTINQIRLIQFKLE